MGINWQRRGRRRESESELRTYLHMFAQRARMGIRLVAAGNSTIVRLVGRVDVTVLLAVAAVREPPLAA